MRVLLRLKCSFPNLLSFMKLHADVWWRQIPRSLFMGEIYYVWGDTNSGRDQAAFSSFVRAMLAKDTAAIGRYVSRDGMDAKMGEKKTEMKNAMPVVTAVMPVLPPSEIPVADSMNAVTGDVPMSAPMLMLNASTQ